MAKSYANVEFSPRRLPLKLILSPALPSIHKGRKVVFEFGIGCKNGENVGLGFAAELKRMFVSLL